MQKKIEDKIYTLSYIKARQDWKDVTKKNILFPTEDNFSQREFPVPFFLKGGVILAGIFLVVFLSVNPLSLTEKTLREEKEEQEVMEIKEEFSALRNDLYEVQKSVLSMSVSFNKEEEKATDQEIIKHYLEEIKKEEDITENKGENEEKIKNLEELLEEEDYPEAFNELFNILTEQ